MTRSRSWPRSSRPRPVASRPRVDGVHGSGQQPRRTHEWLRHHRRSQRRTNPSPHLPTGSIPAISMTLIALVADAPHGICRPTGSGSRSLRARSECGPVTTVGNGIHRAMATECHPDGTSRCPTSRRSACSSVGRGPGLHPSSRLAWRALRSARPASLDCSARSPRRDIRHGLHWLGRPRRVGRRK